MSAAVGRIAVVIPAYNEAATVREIATSALAHTALVVVIDDGSTDGTAGRLEGLPVVVLRNPANEGKAASLWRGFEHALAHGADGVVSLDADGQHCPADIPRLVALAAVFPGHLVMGARLGERARIPRLRRFGQMMADFWISWAAGLPMRDTQSGYRLYPAALLRELDLPHGRRHSFVFESEALIEAAWAGYGVVCIGVDAVYGRSPRASHYRTVADTLSIVGMVGARLLRRGLHPVGLLRALGLLGAARPSRALAALERPP